MTAHLLTIGDEILIGQITDTNSAWMAQQLNLIGIQVTKMISISDTDQAIREALDQSFQETDLVLMTGGLGPTKDDITKKSLADYFGHQMVFSQVIYDHIEALFAKWGRKPSQAHHAQSFMPDQAKILINQAGTAPGMWFEKDGKYAVSMPGVPYEMKYLMEHEVIPLIQKSFPGQPIVHRTILTIGEGESRLAHRIEDFENNLPLHIKLAYLPNLGQVRLRLSATGPDEDVLNKELEEKVAELHELIPQFIFGYEKETIAEVVGRMLVEEGKTIGFAESCTGGYLSHTITTTPGSSAYFQGSVITYANELKEKILGVSAETLAEHGAVSEQTVIEMVKGGLAILETDIVVSISGIAGPSGGTPEKPVGTIWVAVGDKNRVKTTKLQLGKTRLNNIKYTCTAALNMVRQFLLGTLA